MIAMRASLRRLHSPDVHNLRELSDAHAGREVLVQALIGPAEGPGEESFSFLLSHDANLADKRWHWNRGTLSLAQMKYEDLESAVVHECERAVGDTWHEIARLLGRNLHWEFEGYTPYSDR